MKNRINNKGFTLVELIIVIAILSIVLGLGYRIIIGTNKATKHQAEVFSEQQNANLINKYLTKDLEQVRHFTPAEDTSLNTYIYTINDGIEGIEKVEYKVQKKDDGKFYSLTRIAGSTSIELISNYPTNSDVPFSINKVGNSDNIFRVTLNGKGKDYEVGKYEFEVTSRLGNIVFIGEDQEGGNQEDEENDTNTPQEALNTDIRFSFDKDKGQDILLTQINTFINDEPKESHTENTNIDKNQKTFNIKATIPVKNSSSLNIELRNLGKHFSVNWPIFEQKLVKNGIDIYSGSKADINSVKVGGNKVEPNNGRYRCSLPNNPGTVDVEVEFDVQNFNKESFVTIGFGKYYEESNQ